MLGAALIALTLAGPPAPAFVAEQRRAPRVAAAFERAGPRVRGRFEAAGAPFPPRAIFLRGLKRERTLELWAEGTGGRYVRVATYPVCAASGDLGPKRREGDGQVPEGFYRIVHFNPASTFLLSLGLDYPNASDRRLGGPRPGSAIYIHGACASIGCLALGDAAIEEVYVAAVLARGAGQERIPVHLFPGRLDDAGARALVFRRGLGAPSPPSEAGRDPTPPGSDHRPGDAALHAFWRDLRTGFERFERDRRPPRVEVDAGGRYRFR